MRYVEVVEILRKKGVMVRGRLSKENELLLAKICNGAVFVTHYPSSVKPFYMKRTSDERYVSNAEIYHFRTHGNFFWCFSFTEFFRLNVISMSIKFI